MLVCMILVSTAVVVDAIFAGYYGFSKDEVPEFFEKMLIVT